jgi:hypothetical protein
VNSITLSETGQSPNCGDDRQDPVLPARSFSGSRDQSFSFYFAVLLRLWRQISSCDVLAVLAEEWAGINIKSISEIKQEKIKAGALASDALIKHGRFDFLDCALLISTFYSGLVYSTIYSFFESFPARFPCRLPVFLTFFLALLISLVVWNAYFYYNHEAKMKSSDLGPTGRATLPSAFSKFLATNWWRTFSKTSFPTWTRLTELPNHGHPVPRYTGSCPASASVSSPAACS